MASSGTVTNTYFGVCCLGGGGASRQAHRENQISAESRLLSFSGDAEGVLHDKLMLFPSTFMYNSKEIGSGYAALELSPLQSSGSARSSRIQSSGEIDDVFLVLLSGIRHFSQVSQRQCYLA